MVYVPRPQASPFLVSGPSFWGQLCLALFNNLRDQDLVRWGIRYQSCPDRGPGFQSLGAVSRLECRCGLGGAVLRLWDLDRGKGRAGQGLGWVEWGQGCGAFSDRHTVIGDAVGNLGHGQPGVNGWRSLLAPPGR